jgi:hypothetical protein
MSDHSMPVRCNPAARISKWPALVNERNRDISTVASVKATFGSTAARSLGKVRQNR